MEDDAKARTVVLVEGASDQLALETLAGRHGRDLGNEGITIVPIGGATSVGRFLRQFGPPGVDARLAGLCDVGEEGYSSVVSNALAAVPISPERTWKRSASMCASPTSRTN